MIVVSNTSPLTNLAAIGQFHLLQDLYHELHIPEGVWNELNAGGIYWPGRADVDSAPWIHRHMVRNPFAVQALRENLDAGESESIVLASELQADLILLDEREGRHIAQRMGFSVIGTVGALTETPYARTGRSRVCPSTMARRAALGSLRTYANDERTREV